MQEQANAQQQKVATQVRAVGDELSSMASNSAESGPATELVRQVSAQAQDTASWLETHEPGDVVEAAREFARRRPGAFLAGAAVAGLVAGRLTRAGVDVRRDTSDGGSSGSGHGHEVQPTPATEPVPDAPVAATADPLAEPGVDPIVEPGLDPYDPSTVHDDRGIR